MQEQGKLQLTKEQFCQFDKFLNDSLEGQVGDTIIKIWGKFKKTNAEIYKEWQQQGNQPEVIKKFFSLVRRAKWFFVAID